MALGSNRKPTPGIVGPVRVNSSAAASRKPEPAWRGGTEAAGGEGDPIDRRQNPRRHWRHSRGFHRIPEASHERDAAA